MISFDKFFNLDPEVEFFPEFDYEEIKSITYRGADFKGKPTRIFARIAFPKGENYPVPAVILIHGGGGHPDDDWIRKWTAQGYAALAMSTEGEFPTKPACFCDDKGSEVLVHKLIPPFYKDGYTEGPSTTHIADAELPLEDQWMFHAVASVIMGFNLLCRDKRVDENKIGICGISWGGIMASIAIGYDNRFAFAVPIYGSGYLGCGLSGLDKIFNVPSTQKWYAEKRFDRVKIPVMWLCWNDDCCFSINSNSMSFQDTVEQNENTCLSMLHKMGHSHPEAFNPKESYWFANKILAGEDIPKVRAEYQRGLVKYSCQSKIKAARLFYITEKMTYTNREKYGIRSTFMAQEWQIVDLDPNKDQGEIPLDAVGKYVEFTLENGVILTTPYNEFKN